jgi:nucleoside 2-deoxyribosyltransferase
MRTYTEQLRAEGIEVVSAWPDLALPSVDGFTGVVRQIRQTEAMLCLQQIVACNVMVLFGDVPHAADPRGGKHVEMGVAVALGKRVLLCGAAENIFHELPDVEQRASWGECFARILELRETDALTVRQAAREAGVMARTIRDAIVVGQLPAAKRAGHYVIGRNDLDRFKAQRRRRQAEVN